MHTLQFDRYFTPCSHGPFVRGALFRFVPFFVTSSSPPSVSSTSPYSSRVTLTFGRQIVVLIAVRSARPEVDPKWSGNEHRRYGISSTSTGYASKPARKATHLFASQCFIRSAKPIPGGLGRRTRTGASTPSRRSRASSFTSRCSPAPPTRSVARSPSAAPSRPPHILAPPGGCSRRRLP